MLLAQRARPPGVGRWTVPGGKVELGESLETAALRELEEETGLRATLGPVVEVLDRIVRAPDGRIEFHFVIVDFLGTDPRGSLTPASDCADARWVAFSDLHRYPTTDGLGPVIERARALRDHPLPGPLRVHEDAK